jgi:hypothetical protein
MKSSEVIAVLIELSADSSLSFVHKANELESKLNTCSKKSGEKGVNPIFHRWRRMTLACLGTSPDFAVRKCMTGIFSAPLVCHRLWKNRVDPFYCTADSFDSIEVIRNM